VSAAEFSGAGLARQSVFDLRSRTRWIAPNARERDCGVMCIEHRDEEPSIEIRSVDGAPRAKWCGLMTCGHIWTCPVCSQHLRAQRADNIVRAVGHLGGRWQMVTVTVRHRQGLSLKALRDGLMAAWRRTRQGGRIQRVWSERVSASIRAQEVTHGDDNGWHPHIHVLLRTTEWDEDERDALQARWELAVVRELGEHCRPDDLHGLVWSKPFDASRDSGQRATYLAKLGLETAGLAKEGRNGSRTPWDIARAAAGGDSRSLWLWREYASATKGKRMIELDDRALAAAKRSRELEFDVEAGDVKEVARVAVKRDDVRALRRLERRIGAVLVIVLRAAETGGDDAVREWIAYARANAWKPAVCKAPAPHENLQREAG
jgi:Replication protein